MQKIRKYYSSQEKVALLHRHLEQGEAVSKLCEKQALRPRVFYRWKKKFFEGCAASGSFPVYTSNRRSMYLLAAVQTIQPSRLTEYNNRPGISI